MATHSWKNISQMSDEEVRREIEQLEGLAPGRKLIGEHAKRLKVLKKKFKKADKAHAG